jgi:hypothetical protein
MEGGSFSCVSTQTSSIGPLCSILSLLPASYIVSIARSRATADLFYAVVSTRTLFLAIDAPRRHLESTAEDDKHLSTVLCKA